MDTWKAPPIAKVYEALSALASGRVLMIDGQTAHVVSSSRDKSYIVQWDIHRSAFTSNDNGSYWQGYIGYPIIAVMLGLDRLPYDRHLAQVIADVHWKELNTEASNDFDKAVKRVLSQLDPTTREQLKTLVDSIHTNLGQAMPGKLRSDRKPPVSHKQPV